MGIQDTAGHNFQEFHSLNPSVLVYTCCGLTLALTLPSQQQDTVCYWLLSRHTNLIVAP